MKKGGWDAGRQRGYPRFITLNVPASKHQQFPVSEDRWKNLNVWKLADQLAYEIYLVTPNFPKEEIYGLTSQLRRAALSIPTNIVEGYSRKGDKELAHFINISLGSMAETKYLLHFAHRLGYFSEQQYNEIKNGYESLGKKLWRFYEAVRNKSDT